MYHSDMLLSSLFYYCSSLVAAILFLNCKDNPATVATLATATGIISDNYPCPLTWHQKKDLNIIYLESCTMASEDLIDAKLETFETRMEDKLHTLFVEFKQDRSPSSRRSQRDESSDSKENPPDKE
ncbi:hypothetical protein GW17_00016534 [Ensete ventricosum]|nr:hypothetical protein GW17_00016534 [Ensete ventricosum]